MAITISFANQKGGPGKTTILFCTAYALQLMMPRDRIGILDGDSQATLTNFYSQLASTIKPALFLPKDDIGKLDLSENNIQNAIKKAQSECDVLFMDTPGKFDSSLIPFLCCSDIIITPFRVTSADLSTTIAFCNNFLPKVKQQHNLSFRCFMLANQVKKSSNQVKALTSLPALQDIQEKLGVYLFKAFLSDRIHYGGLPHTLPVIVEQEDFIGYIKEFVNILKNKQL